MKNDGFNADENLGYFRTTAEISAQLVLEIMKGKPPNMTILYENQALVLLYSPSLYMYIESVQPV